MFVQDVEQAFGQRELWRRQCARNLMDCYALALEASSGSWLNGEQGHKTLEQLVQFMVTGLTGVRNEEDEKSFYKTAAVLCRECAKALEGTEKARLFRIYAAIFEDM